jgi:hypothetical protein
MLPQRLNESIISRSDGQTFNGPMPGKLILASSLKHLVVDVRAFEDMSLADEPGNQEE